MKASKLRLGLFLLGLGGLPGAGEIEAWASEQGSSRRASYRQVRNISEGISWPEGQALPIFATPAATLDAIEVQSLTIDEQLTFSALQGHVNKKQPRIYLLDARADQGRDTWADTSTVALEWVELRDREEKYQLLAKYSGEVEGLVLYDPARSPHYRNLAGTVAALRRALPVTAEVRDRLREHEIELDVLVDLTELTMTSPVEIYRHLYGSYWPRCEKRLLISARPDDRGGDHHHTRDIAAACGAAVVWLDNRLPEEREVMRMFLGDMTAGDAVILGWYTSERSGITTASEFGIGTLPADHYTSASVYSGTDHRIRVPAVPERPELENKAYVAVFISDGDNIQYAQRALRRIWDRHANDRGKVAMNWTIAPGLVDIGPAILNYYYATATSKDCFVAGPSGMGYLMPCNTLNEPGAPVGLYLADEERMNGYARLTEAYLRRAGLRVVTIWDDATPMHRASYESNCRYLYGATVHNFKDVPSVKASVENGRLRFDKLVIPYVGTYEHFRRSLDEQLGRWDGAAPLFLAYQVSIWNEMKPDRIVRLARDVQRQYPGKVEFVRADHYFNLHNEAHGLPFNLVLSPRTSATAGASSADARRAADGSPDTTWRFPSDERPTVLRFDFGDVHRLTRYVIRRADAETTGGVDVMSSYTLRASTDGRRWTTIDSRRRAAELVTDVDLDPVAARYVTLTVDDIDDDSAAGIAEVEVYGIKWQPMPLRKPFRFIPESRPTTRR